MTREHGGRKRASKRGKDRNRDLRLRSEPTDRVVKVEGDAEAVIEAIEGKPEGLMRLRRLIGSMSNEERMAITIDALTELVAHVAGADEDELIDHVGEA